SLARSGAGSGLPSTRLSLAVVTVIARLVSTAPPTMTRPSAIQRSASRREHSPARASTLAILWAAIRCGASAVAVGFAIPDNLRCDDRTRHNGRRARRQSPMTARRPVPPAMARALDEAAAAARRGEVPVGTVLVDAAGEVVVASGNRVEQDTDPTAHAEMLALRAGAARLGLKRLADCDLYVTLEPCPMCAAAIGLARIRRPYFAAYDPKAGG